MVFAKLFIMFIINWIKIAQALSVVPHLAHQMPPTLIIHGTADQTVPFQQSESLRDALVSSGNNCTLVRVRDAGHGFSLDPPDAELEAKQYRLILERVDVFLSSLGLTELWLPWLQQFFNTVQYVHDHVQFWPCWEYTAFCCWTATKILEFGCTHTICRAIVAVIYSNTLASRTSSRAVCLELGIYWYLDSFGWLSQFYQFVYGTANWTSFADFRSVYKPEINSSIPLELFFCHIYCRYLRNLTSLTYI